MDRRTLLIAAAASSALGSVVAARRLLTTADAGLLKPIQPASSHRVSRANGYTISPVPLGAGGFVTGLDISSDGERVVCWTDVMGAYVRDINASEWKPMFGPGNIPKSDFEPMPAMGVGPGQADGLGCAGVRIAPSDKNIIYSMYLGRVYRSNDGGKTAYRTSLAPKRQAANGASKSLNSPLAIHPRDPNTIIVGTFGEGVHYSTDAGENWAKIQNLPQSLAIGNSYFVDLVLIDPVDPDNVYIHVAGSGIYYSNKGVSGEFIHLNGSPNVIESMIWSNRNIYLCERDKNRIFILNHRGEFDIINCQYPPKILVIDPDDPNHIMAFTSNAHLMESFDHGKSWRPNFLPKGNVRNTIGVAGEVSWMLPVHQVMGNIVRDPKTKSSYYMASGYGVLKLRFGSSSNYLESLNLWIQDWSNGIDVMIGTSGVSIPGRPAPILACWDTALWKVQDMKRYTNKPTWPAPKGMDPDPSKIQLARSVDYAIDDPDFLVATVGFDATGYSIDGGENWTSYESQPAVQGVIAVSKRDQLVWLPSNNGPGVWSNNGGVSWNTIKLDGINPTKEFANAYYVERYNLSSDKCRPGVFALVYTVMQSSSDPTGRPQDPYDNPLGGVWVTHDGGSTWRQTWKGVVGYGYKENVPYPQENRQYWQCKLSYVPGRCGELLYTPHADYKDDRLWWSRDDGETWTQVGSSVRDVTSFGFGKSQVGQVYPTVFLWAVVDGVRGLYVSMDWFATTPKLISENPTAMISLINNLVGDVNIFGRVYISSSGNGWWKTDID